MTTGFEMPALAQLSQYMETPQDGLLQLLMMFNDGASDGEEELGPPSPDNLDDEWVDEDEESE